MTDLNTAEIRTELRQMVTKLKTAKTYQEALNLWIKENRNLTETEINKIMRGLTQSPAFQPGDCAHRDQNPRKTMSQLKTETNTPETNGRITGAAAAYFDLFSHQVEAHYEHGQWLVSLNLGPNQWEDYTPTYSVVDAIGNDAVDGFSFEEV